MISTVTTTVSSIAVSQFAQVFAGFAIAFFIILLIQKEITSEAAEGTVLARLNKVAEILLLTLGMATVAILAVAFTGLL